METSFKAVVQFALLVFQIRCLTSTTDGFCFQKYHLIAIYSCVVQWFMFVYFILFLGMKGGIDMTDG
jgi:hypothetical protein